MTTQDLYPGAPVKLKTGSPTMTLQYFDDGGHPHCSWYEHGRYRGWTFEREMVEIVLEERQVV